MVKAHIKTIGYSIVLSIATCMLTACFGSDPTQYPTKWGDTIHFNNENIHLLEGTYESIGLHAFCSNISGGTQWTNLAYMLFEQEPGKIDHDLVKYRQCDSVSFRIVNERDILIEAYKNGEFIKRKILTHNQFSIKNGWLTIDSVGAQSVVVATQFEKLLYQIRVNYDGDLVFKEKTSGFGLLLIIPMGGYDERWYYFRRKK